MKKVYWGLILGFGLSSQIALADVVVVQPTPVPSPTFTVDQVAYGPGSSGGGPAIVFMDDQNKVQSAEMLDLYEGQIRFNLQITRSSVPAQQQIDAIVARLRAFNSFMADDLDQAIQYVQSHETFLPEGVMEATVVNDLGSNYAPVIPEGSQLDYAGFYQADGTLEISSTVFNKFASPTDQAAFYIHEGIYKLARRFSHATDSENSRKFVAYLFAGADLNQLSAILPEFTWRNTEAYLQGTPFGGYLAGFTAPVRLQGNAGVFTVDTKNASSHQTVEFECVNEDGQAINAYTADISNDQESQVSFPDTLPDGELCAAISVSFAGSMMGNLLGTISWGNEVIATFPNPVASDGVDGIDVPVYYSAN